MWRPRKGFDSDSSCSGITDIFCPSTFWRLNRHNWADNSGAAAHQQGAIQDTRASSRGLCVHYVSWVPSSYLWSTITRKQPSIIMPQCPALPPTGLIGLKPSVNLWGNNAPSSCLNSTLASLEPLICSEV